MNVALWIIQGLLAVHTAIGAVWKFSHSAEQTMPSLKAIPQGVWLAMSGLEILCAMALVIPAVSKSLGILAPIAAACIALEMILFCVIHLQSEGTQFGPMSYWLVVAVICIVIVYGRWSALKSL